MTTTSPRPQSSKARDPQAVELGYRGDGEFGALSSDGQTVYTVRWLAWGDLTCSCAGYHHRGACCHVAAVAARFGTCQHCGATDEPLTQVGEHADGSALLRCADEAACIRRWNV